MLCVSSHYTSHLTCVCTGHLGLTLSNSGWPYAYFLQTYSSDDLQYCQLSSCITDDLPDCDASLFNTTAITPSLVKSTLRRCLMKFSSGSDGITYFHLSHLPSTHHFMATLFNKLLEKGISPASWGLANVKLIYKTGDTSDLTNFRPIALTSVVGKNFHKILSYCLEDYLRKNIVIDTCIQKGFISNLPGVYEHIYSECRINKKIFNDNFS